MNRAKIVNRDGGGFSVTGPVVMNNAGELLETSRKLFNNNSSMIVDLAGVTVVDSAALALLIEWLRIARRDNCRIRVNGIPEKLMAIAKLTGVDDIVLEPITTETP